MSNEVLETGTFSKLFDSLPNDEKDWIKKIIGQLEENYLVGKPLRFDWFREKKYRGKRLYYIVYKNIDRVLLVAFGKKKDQQQIIGHILANRARYKKIVENV